MTNSALFYALSIVTLQYEVAVLVYDAMTELDVIQSGNRILKSYSYHDLALNFCHLWIIQRS